MVIFTLSTKPYWTDDCCDMDDVISLYKIMTCEEVSRIDIWNEHVRNGLSYVRIKLLGMILANYYVLTSIQLQLIMIRMRLSSRIQQNEMGMLIEAERSLILNTTRCWATPKQRMDLKWQIEGF